MKKIFIQFLQGEDGSPAIEYSIIAGLVAVVIILALTLIGNNLGTLYATIKTALSGI